jgi:uncharacterized repeat protein (TIGR03806 family)
MNTKKEFTGRRACTILVGCIVILCVPLVNGCDEDGLSSIKNNLEMSGRLSDYQIFDGDPAALTPSAFFHLLELPTELFTDYAEKQRLIKVPAGSTLTAMDEGLPEFPEGTMLVKTFYYNKDKRAPEKGKRIVETRLEIKSNGKWNVGTYVWNDEQTDAILITTGLNKTINWIDAMGKPNVISYRIPSTRECATCHQSSGKIIPIGPKLRNLNIEVTRNSTAVNQLGHLHNSGVLDAASSANIPALPDWKNGALSLSERARAYLDVNCAHCHNSHGVASDTRLNFSYETSFGDTNINDRKKAILDRLRRGEMPRLGTSILHKEGLDLIESYIKSL